MNIVLINQFYPPSSAPTGKLLHDLAQCLASRGHRVTVLSSAGHYGATTGIGPTADTDGIQIMRLGENRLHSATMFAKMADYLGFFRQADRILAKLNPVPDLVLCLTTPPFCGHIGRKLKQRKGVPYAIWCMDLYPEALVAHGLIGPHNPLNTLLRGIARRERQQAGLVITLGPDMSALVQRDTSMNVLEVPVWSDVKATPEAIKDAKALRFQRGWGPDDVILLYSGNMGRAHRAEEFAELAARLRNTSRCCRFVMCGGGPRMAEWQKKYRGLFEFIPPSNRESLAAHLLSADVHLVSQQPDWTGVVVPSKFQAACAVGRPVVYAGPVESSVAAWIRESDSGWILPPGDRGAVEHVSGNILDARERGEKGPRAFQLFNQKFTRKNCSLLADALEQLTVKRT